MQKLFFIIFFFSIYGVLSQTCPRLTNPIDGATNVPVNSTIRWNNVDGATGYIISIGTFAGGSDILSNQTGTNSFTPPLGLPDNTEIFVTITLFFFNLPNVVCSTESFITEDITTPPSCTSLSSPANGAIDVNIGANISWNYTVGATGYLISIGTSSGTGDILNNLDVGNALQYNPIVDFSPLTEIFVTIVPYNENGNLTSCNEESFITGALAALPSCSTLISPVDGQTNVPLSPFIEWEASLGATGYKVYIGSSPFENDVLDEGVFFTNSTFVLNFESNSLYFIRIIPFNSSGDALSCSQSRFSTVLGCGPFFDSFTGELVTLNPEINFPDQIEICLDQDSTLISSSDQADGFRWYFINSNSDEILISSDAQVDISETGNYIYEAYNFSLDPSLGIECSSFREFNVIATDGLVTIDNVNVNEVSGGLEILIEISGSGNFEYSIVSANGPFQDSNFFENAPFDTSTVYARDKNGCGNAEYRIRQLSSNIFPSFFTPNSDGFHDFWQYQPQSSHNFIIEAIYIYSQYGKLLKQLNAYGEGWNGTLNGKLLPNSDYWYSAKASNGKIYKGHFSLIR